MAKKLVQRQLDITTTYTIVGSYYRSMEDGGGCCDNCGKMISNIAEIVSARGTKHVVGMDCASTLTGIKDDFDFDYVHKANFTTAKSARAALVKSIKKEGFNVKATTFETAEGNFFKQAGSGMWSLEFPNGSSNWKQYRAEVWSKYVLPMISDLLTKPEDWVNSK